MTFDEVPKPAGEVSGVCWSLLGAVVTGAGIALKWMSGKLEKAEVDLKDERKTRDQDRKDFEAQTNVMVQNIFKKKGSPNDS